MLLIFIAHSQGIRAAYADSPSPLSCPWSVEMYEEVLAWLAGYRVGIMARASLGSAMSKKWSSEGPTNHPGTVRVGLRHRA